MLLQDRNILAKVIRVSRLNRADASGDWGINEQESRPRAVLTRNWPGANDMQRILVSVSSICRQGREGIVGGGIKISIGENAQ